LDDCVRNGVKRFVPSDFTFNIWDLPEGEHKSIDWKLWFRKKLSKTNIKGLHFTHGIFMETYFWFVKKYGFNYWGDINQKIDLTAEQDVAKAVAAAVSNPNWVGDVKIWGAELSTKELWEWYTMVTGEKCDPKWLGSLEDLKKKMAEEKGKDMELWMLLGFMLPLFDGRGKIKMNNNGQFPEIKWTTVEDFLKGCKTKGLNYEFPMPELAKKFEEIVGK